MTTADVYGLAAKAAREYKEELFKTSGINESNTFDRAEECFRAGYERALLDNIATN